MTRYTLGLFVACLAALLPVGDLVAASDREKSVLAPRGLCERVARLENGKKLQSMLVRPRPAGVFVQEGVGGQRFTVDQFEFQLDINNDGSLDKVTLRKEREYPHSAQLSVRDAADNEMKFSLAPEEPDGSPAQAYRDSGSADLGFLSIGGRVYIVQWREGSYPYRESSWLSNVALVDSSNTAHPVCHFAATRERSSHAWKGTARVCDAVLKGQQTYVAFNLPVASEGPLRVVEEPGGIVESHSIGAAAEVDIDNDGMPEHVVKVIQPNMLSHGCDNLSIARLDRDRSVLTRASALEFSLHDFEVCSDQNLQPFVFEGTTYVERRYSSTFPSNLHDVLKLTRGGAPIEVCRFDVRKRYHVASEYEVFSGEDLMWLQYAPERPYAFGLWEKAIARDAWHLLDLMWEREPELRTDLSASGSAFPYMELAIESGRAKFVDWLLDHGVDVNAADEKYPEHNESPLEVALDAADEHPSMPLRLIRRGADPTGSLSDVVSFAEDNGERGRTLVREAARSLGYVPEEFFEYAHTNDMKLLDELVNAGLPPPLTRVTWWRGEDNTSEWWMDLDNFDNEPPAVRRAIRVLAARKPKLARELEVSSGYELGDQTWNFRGTARTRREIDEFVMFATATCVFYLPAECGSDEIVSRARAWVRRLPDCERGLSERYGDRLCRVVGYANQRESAGVGLQWESRKPGDGSNTMLGAWEELSESYAPKEWPQASERRRSR